MLTDMCNLLHAFSVQDGSVAWQSITTWWNEVSLVLNAMPAMICKHMIRYAASRSMAEPFAH